MICFRTANDLSLVASMPNTFGINSWLTRASILTGYLNWLLYLFLDYVGPAQCYVSTPGTVHVHVCTCIKTLRE